LQFLEFFRNLISEKTLKTATMKFFINTLAIFLIAFGISDINAQGNLLLQIQNFEVDNGPLIVKIYNSQESFLKHPYKLIELNSNKSILNHMVLNLPDGNYAVEIFQDVNLDRKMTLKTFGLKEAHIYSGNKTFTDELKFSETSFEVKANSKKLLSLNLSK
jgi:uncharacterized protein (DUF2141 family)